MKEGDVDRYIVMYKAVYLFVFHLFFSDRKSKRLLAVAYCIVYGTASLPVHYTPYVMSHLVLFSG